MADDGRSGGNWQKNMRTYQQESRVDAFQTQSVVPKLSAKIEVKSGFGFEVGFGKKSGN
jgi:hypothetical protein